MDKALIYYKIISYALFFLCIGISMISASAPIGVVFSNSYFGRQSMLSPKTHEICFSILGALFIVVAITAMINIEVVAELLLTPFSKNQILENIFCGFFHGGIILNINLAIRPMFNSNSGVRYFLFVKHIWAKIHLASAVVGVSAVFIYSIVNIFVYFLC